MNSLKCKTLVLEDLYILSLWVFFHCWFSFNKPTKMFSKINPTQYEAQDDVTSLILCLFIVLGLFSIQYSPGPPSSADQQYVTLWPTNTICNILRCIMQNSGQQYRIFWPTTIACNFAHWIFPLFLFSSTMPIGQICMSLWKSNTADLLN